MKSGFLNKLIERLDQVEPEEIQALVTRLMREKGFLEGVFEALQEGVFILDTQGHITFLNSAASKIFGIHPQQCIGQSLSTTIRGFDWHELTNSERIISKDLEILYPEKRFLNVYTSPMHGELKKDEQLLGYVLLVRDITRSKIQAIEDAESEKLNALTLLAAGVAHEIGNPLNSMDIHLQLLKRKIKKLSPEDSESLGNHLETAQAEIKRLDSILKQFLSAVRPTQPKRSQEDLHKLLSETIELLEPELEARNVNISLSKTDLLPLLELDSTQIKQALFNLIRNALQALPADGGIIDISTHTNDYEVALVIHDHGSGIPPEVMGSLFEPYLTTKKSGTGLGLLIVRRIVRAHGGEITIDSKKGEGTTVSIHFPRQDRHVRLIGDTPQTVIDLEETSDS